MSGGSPDYETHAREMYGLPDDWMVCIWEALGKPGKPQAIALTGAVVTEVFKSGPRKGEKNWKKRDRSTQMTVSIPKAAHQKWLLEWEQKTGLCHECNGKGEVFKSWDRETGTQMKPCRRCDGTGKAPTTTPGEPA
ncbi:hypothetical protein HMPREF9946_03097 [Acetobacteraceae bacterium AT-5844]|nr:hypothetical protein HMPREF9946_03097 [Acetobacteraceae bacterium AT-5844]